VIDGSSLPASPAFCFGYFFAFSPKKFSETT
jgi:hypothetical protein